MKCNYKPPKLSKEEQQDMASIKSTLPYIDRLQAQWRNSESIEDCCFRGSKYCDQPKKECEGVMIVSRCYQCCHEEICNYKQRFNNAVEEVYNTSYAVGNGKVELLKDSAIVVELKCPHFMNEKDGEQQ